MLGELGGRNSTGNSFQNLELCGKESVNEFNISSRGRQTPCIHLAILPDCNYTASAGCIKVCYIPYCVSLEDNLVLIVFSNLLLIPFRIKMFKCCLSDYLFAILQGYTSSMNCLYKKKKLLK